MLQVARIRVFPLAIPMRLKFEHAAALRSIADPMLIELAARPPFAGVAGWGETLARGYVTGESVKSVIDTIRDRYAPVLAEFRAGTFEEAVALADQLSFEFEGTSANAARAAVELAWLDLAGRAFQRPLRDAAFAAFPRIQALPETEPPRYSGMVIGRGTMKLKFLVRAQYAYGLRDFKIKVAIPDWERRLCAAHTALRHPMQLGKATLRVDANGGWSLEDALRAIPLLESCNVAAIEQPLPPRDDAQIPRLVTATKIPIMPDESLVSLADAKRLIELGAGMLNIRIAKVGGLLPALQMAQLAMERGCGVQLGCLVGETSVLSAAGQVFARTIPITRFLEGAFGRWLLKREVARPAVQFGYGGRVETSHDAGLGVQVVESEVLKFTTSDPLVIAL